MPGKGQSENHCRPGQLKAGSGGLLFGHIFSKSQSQIDKALLPPEEHLAFCWPRLTACSSSLLSALRAVWLPDTAQRSEQWSVRGKWLQGAPCKVLRHSLACDGDSGSCGSPGAYGSPLIAKDARTGASNFPEGEGLVSASRWPRKGTCGKGWEEECPGVPPRFCSHRGLWGQQLLGDMSTAWDAELAARESCGHTSFSSSQGLLSGLLPQPQHLLLPPETSLLAMEERCPTGWLRGRRGELCPALHSLPLCEWSQCCNFPSSFSSGVTPPFREQSQRKWPLSTSLMLG